jgi:16S rRNA (cytosine1402-N4)-methyltransferase
MSAVMQASGGASHVPVMLEEVLAALEVGAGDVVVDGTFGAGGYSRAVLDAQPKCRVIAIDRDPNVREVAKAMEAEYAGRFAFVAGCFGDMSSLLANLGIEQVQGIMLDIGVSSMQLDQAERGFSFRMDGPLDMRMSQSGMSAADVVNQTSEEELADIIYHLGEEKASRRIAKNIVLARAVKPIETTAELADIVRSCVKKSPKDLKDPATRTFQALRIHVNAELDELHAALKASEQLLSEGGRLAVVVFHSLEDRVVKQFLQEHGRVAPSGSRHLPELVQKKVVKPSFRLKKPFPMLPKEAEIKKNARSRSAKLRAAIRTDAPVLIGKM